MPTSLTSRLGRAVRGLWWLLNFMRHALLNLLLVALLLAAAALWWKSRPPAALQPKTALVLDLTGRLVEQRSIVGVRAGLVRQARGDDDEAQTQLRDVLQALDAAAKDAAITHALLLVDDLGAAGLPKLREVAAAMQRFKAAGKPIYAWASGYDQRQFYLAAQATEVWMHPMGHVDLQGFGGRRTYFKDLLDRVGVQAHVVRAGRFKNVSEPFAANGPSPATTEADTALYGTLWASYTAGVEAARKQPAGSVMQAIDSLPGSLVAAGGDGARWAVERHWVDALKTRDEMRTAMIAKGAALEGDGPKTFRQVHIADYLARVSAPTARNVVAVVVAEGGISDGVAGPGRIGARSTGELIRQAREDQQVKAVVLRVDSPGGSAFASEVVRRELELTRQAGKPVVVSMGDVAASGGYWISLAADEIIADETTVTGSIGVIAMLPTAEGAAEKLGLHTEGVTTTWLRGAYDPRKGLDPRYEQMVQASIDRIYRDFLTRAATQRKRTPEQIDAVAQGRVWAGRTALEIGLIDRVGSFGDALKSAAARAKLEDGSWRTRYVEAQPGRLQLLLRRLGLIELIAPPTAAELAPEMNGMLTALGLPLAGETARELGWLAELLQHRGTYSALAHCGCEAP